jgi:glutamyl-tRNA reductase
MRYKDGESFEDWLERVRIYEYGIALQRIANGEVAEVVLEEMAGKIVKKGLHPILMAIRSAPTNYDVEEGRRRYSEAIKGKGASSDHVVEDTNK